MVQLSVILVEDDRDLSDITAEHLRLRNVHVDQVYSGIEFYAALQQKTYDAAVVDLGLPDQPGTVLIQYAAANTTMAIVVVSASDQAAKRISCYEAGADTFLSKPVDPEELYVALIGLSKKSKDRHQSAEVGLAVTVNTPASSPPPSVSQVADMWVLDAIKRQLISPDGTRVDLNHNEFKLCYRLALNNGDIVDRAHMLESIYKRDDESAQRALDTLVRRLRKKIADDTSGNPPIMTNYGLGHSFTEHIDIIR